MKKHTGLGRGLSAILEAQNYSEEIEAANRLEELSVESIVPNPKQPRTTFDDNALEELADSIATLGLIQPITVRKEENCKYVIISGERRWRATKLAGLKTIAAYIREADDKELHEMALVENIQRQDLNAMEIAISLQRLIDECGVTQENVAQRVGKKRSTVANYLRLMQMRPEVQAALKENLITMGHAKAIASAPEDAQSALVKKVIKKELSVRATEQLAKKLWEPATKASEESEEFPEFYTRAVEQLSRLLGEDIKIKRSADGSGKIVIGFASDQDIRSLVERLEQLK
ncbi:MAG: ParB/RepB/Spo0J family partition protein [Tidjanibacter sp.]|nr:ParB/RepB/Spo0J family partition protein [Tidjanibacter sp.]